MRDKGFGMPAAVVLCSPWADITDSGDIAVTLKHAEPMYLYERHLKPSADAYADPKDQKHPMAPRSMPTSPRDSRRR
jgi:epsilon-lactone hydrolase